MGASFGGGDALGVAITIAIAIHNIPEGVTITSSCPSRSEGPERALSTSSQPPPAAVAAGVPVCRAVQRNRNRDRVRLCLGWTCPREANGRSWRTRAGSHASWCTGGSHGAHRGPAAAPGAARPPRARRGHAADGQRHLPAVRAGEPAGRPGCVAGATGARARGDRHHRGPQMRFNDVTIGDLIQATPGSMYGGAGVGAPVAMNLPCGPDGQTLPCVSNGIYLVRDGAERLAIMFKPSGMGMLQHRDEPPGHRRPACAGRETVLREIRTLANERSVFRGQVISFGAGHVRPGAGSTPLIFLPRPTVARESSCCPPSCSTGIERQVVGVARHSRPAARQRPAPQARRAAVRRARHRQDPHGPLPARPAARGDGHRHLRPRRSAAIARGLLGGADAAAGGGRGRGRGPDRRGAHRAARRAPAAVPAAERDGRARTPAVDVTFLLTTNRADLLEPALAARPGRVDQAAELPLPDADARRALIAALPGEPGARRLADLDAVIERTEGVTAPFLRGAAAQGGAARRRGGRGRVRGRGAGSRGPDGAASGSPTRT